jgi:hypothetical protein
MATIKKTAPRIEINVGGKITIGSTRALLEMFHATDPTRGYANLGMYVIVRGFKDASKLERFCRNTDFCCLRTYVSSKECISVDEFIKKNHNPPKYRHVDGKMVGGKWQDGYWEKL